MLGRPRTLRFSVRMLLLTLTCFAVVLGWITTQRRHAANDMLIAEKLWKSYNQVGFEGETHAAWSTRLRYRVCGRRVLRVTVIAVQATNLDCLAGLTKLESVTIHDFRPSIESQVATKPIDLSPLFSLKYLRAIALIDVPLDMQQVEKFSHVPNLFLRRTGLGSVVEKRLSRFDPAAGPSKGVADYQVYLKQIGATAPHGVPVTFP